MTTTQPSLKRQQLIIGFQIAISVPLQLAFAYFGFKLLSVKLPAADTFGDRLAYVFQWEICAVLVLLAMIGMIAGIRPTSIDVIDGNDRADKLAIQVRIQRNTLEQLALMIFGHLALAMMLPFEELRIIPVLILMFIFFRICYWIGYSIQPHFRTFGFVGTFYPNIAVALTAANMFING